MQTKLNLNRGFSIMELVVAIAILSLALASPLVVARKSLASATYARDELTAYYLAQEAIEFVKNVRDNNAFSGNSWLSGLEACEGEGVYCGADVFLPSGSQIFGCDYASNNDCRLVYNAAGHIYGSRYSAGLPQAGWTRTSYTRKINIIPLGNEAIATAIVSWCIVSGGFSNCSAQYRQTFQMKEDLFNLFANP